MRLVTKLWQRIGMAQHGQPKKRRSRSRPAPRIRPRLEALEDRCVPSTLTVTSSADDGSKGTLRYDLAHASNGDTIKITPGAIHGGPIVLTQGELLVNKDVTIEANPNHSATISGNNNSRVFEIASGANVNLSNLSITDGNSATNPGASNYGEGDGVLNFGMLTVSNSTLTANAGRAIYNFGTLMVSNSTLSYNPFGGIINHGGTVTVSNSTLSDSTNGSGIDNFGGGTLTVSNSTLSDNSYFSGGGISNFGGTATVSNSTLSGNTAQSYGNAPQYSDGGGIFNEDGTLTVSNSILSDNSAQSEGGGIFNDDGTLTVSNSTLSGNSVLYNGNANLSPQVGGGIYNGKSGTVTISNNSTLAKNSAFFSGGGIDNFGSMTISNSTLSGNYAYDAGGILNVGALEIDHSTLSSNAAKGQNNMGQGGGIYNLSTLTISNSTLSGNSAYDGGAIYNYEGTLTVDNSTLSGNSARNDGGGIYNYGLYGFGVYGVVTISNSTLSDNSAVVDGGGIYNFFGTVKVGDSSFSGNTPDAISGGYTDEGGNTFS